MKTMVGLAATAALALTACSEQPAPPAADPPAESETPATEPGLSWENASRGDGPALIMRGPDGEQMLRLGCLHHRPRLTLQVDGFDPVGSEERLTFGLDEQLFVFVAEPTAPGPGVSATAPVSADFLERLPRAATLGAVYGAQQFGPYRPPPNDLSMSFAAECRRAAGLL